MLGCILPFIGWWSTLSVVHFGGHLWKLWQRKNMIIMNGLLQPHTNRSETPLKKYFF
jgi:hypothetical protein